MFRKCLLFVSMSFLFPISTLAAKEADKEAITQDDQDFDLTYIFNVGAGLHLYTWPNSSGFLFSTASQLKPDGWSGAVLFKKKQDSKMKQID